MHKILLIPTSTPPLVGIYKDNKLISSNKLESQLSDSLVSFFCDLKEQGILFNELFYVNGPGSYMALKLTYIFAKTLYIVNGVKLHSANGFYFNNNTPIKAYGNYYFAYENDEVKLIKSNKNIYSNYTLPDVLNESIFGDDLEPLYILPAV